MAVTALLTGLMGPVPVNVSGATLWHDVSYVAAEVGDEGGIWSLLYNGSSGAPHLNNYGTWVAGDTNHAGLVFDRDGYDHTFLDPDPGCDDGYSIVDWWDDMGVVNPITYRENTLSRQKTNARFDHSVSDPIDSCEPLPLDDVAFEQTAWSIAGANWVIVQWKVINIDSTDFTNAWVAFTADISDYDCGFGTGGDSGGVGGTGCNDASFWTPASGTTGGTLSVEDPGGITLSLGSADGDRHFDRYRGAASASVGWQSDSDDYLLYYLLTSPNGTDPGGINGVTAMVGWNLGTIPAGTSKTVGFVIAIADTQTLAQNAVENARAFYKIETSRLDITEFSEDPNGDGSAADAMVEVYNDGKPLTDMTTFTVWTETGQMNGTWSVTPLSSGNHSVFTRTGGALPNAEGDTISLIGPLGLSSQVGYGYRGTAPDPLPGESVCLVWSTQDNAYTFDSWNREPTPTQGARNDCPGVVAVPNTVLNEVLFNPATKTAFVEIMYTGLSSVNLQNFLVVVDAPYTLPNVVLDPMHPFYVMQEPSYPPTFGVDALNDNVYLYNSTGVRLDEVGWSTSHTADLCLKRVPDGSGTLNGFNDTSSAAAGWMFDQTCGMGIVWIGPRQTGGGNPGDTVTYLLNVSNLQAFTDTIEFTSSTGPWGWGLSLRTAAGGALPTASCDPLLPEVTLNSWAVTQIRVDVTIGATGDFEYSDIVAVACANPDGWSNVTVRSQVYPHIKVEKIVYDSVPPAMPAEMWQDSAPPAFQPQTATVQLKLVGAGTPVTLHMPQDVVFIVDESGSMVGNDPLGVRIQSVKQYIDRMVVPDRGSVEGFHTAAWIVNNRPLTMTNVTGKALLRADADTLGTNSGGTDIETAVEVANDWERQYSWNDPFWGWNHTRVIILLTDGDCSTSPPACTNTSARSIAMLNDARSMNIRIFTIGLIGGGGVDENYLRWIAWFTGAIYFRATTADDLPRIYETIGTIVQDTAYTPLSDALQPEVTDVVPNTVEVIPGLINPAPASVTPTPTDTWIAWQVDQLIKIGDNWTAIYQIRSDICGYHNVTNYGPAHVQYVAWNNQEITALVPSAYVTVFCWQEIQPPRNLRTSWTPGSSDVILSWDAPASLAGVDYYEVYGGPTPVSLNLVAPNYVCRTFSNATRDCTDANRLVTSSEYYYVVRSVNGTAGQRSWTSNSAGVFRLTFPNAGTNAFSLPLAPFPGGLTVASFLADANANPGAILSRLVGNATAAWTSMAPIDAMSVGEAYLVTGLTAGAVYVDRGLPGAHILYKEGSGFAAAARDDVRARVNLATNDVTLSWTAVTGASRYLVMRSSARDGFFGVLGTDYTVWQNLTALTVTDAGAACLAPETYYAVVPIDAGFARFASSYSSGVVCKPLNGHTGFGLPLRPYDAPDPDNAWTVDTYATRTGGLGVMYFANQVWVPHFAEMPAGVYDPVVAQGAAFQVTVPALRDYPFQGW